jgi:GT2 family glycosyltransferase
VVVNHRTPDATVACVHALRDSARAPDGIIVVENGSRDGSAARLRAALPKVTHVSTEENLGFAGGSNRGIRRALEAGAQRVLLVNSDARVAPDAIARLERALDADSQLGIVGPTIVAAGGTLIESRGIAFSPRTGRVRCLDAGRPLEAALLDEVRPVDAVSGCAMLIAREILDDASGFDEAYFYSFEDLDLCARARQRGKRTACVTAATVTHDGSRTIGAGSPRRIYFATRNHLRFSAQAPSARALRQALVVGWNLLYVLVRAPAPRMAGLVALTRGVRDHVRHRYGAGE